MSAEEEQNSAQLVQKIRKIEEKGCALNFQMHIDKFHLGGYDKAK